jgi:hypothetical protein
VTRPAPRRHQDGVEPDILDAIVGVKRKPDLGGCGDTVALPGRDRPFGLVELAA